MMSVGKVTMIIKNLWRRKTRTFLTMLGIAIGVAAVIALSAFGEGFANGFEQTFSSANADLTVAQRDALMLFLSAVDEELGGELKELSGVDEVAGTLAGFLTLPETPYFVVMGQDPRGFAMAHYRLVEGETLKNRREILLGKTTAKNFKKVIGDHFALNEVNYRVVGIYETGVSLEDGGAVIGLRDAQGLFDKPHQVSYFNLKVREVSRLDEIRKRIETNWPKLAATRTGEATTTTEALNIYRSFGWFLGIFAVLVGGLGMMNTTLMSVFERTREIGVLRAMGWRRRRIISLILGESLTLAIGGGVLGMGLGIGLTRLVALSPAVESLLYGVFTAAMFAQAFMLALVLGTIGGLYPAWRASQLVPVEAMRYESGASVNLGKVTAWLVRRLGHSGSLRNLLRRPVRTLVTLIGIGIGVGFIVTLSAVTEGFTTIFAQLGSVGQIDLLAEQANAADMSLSTIDERIADRLTMHPEVKSVSRMLWGVSSAPGLQFLIVFGLDEHEEYLKHYRIREGHPLERSNEIIMGRFAANSMEKGVGDTVRLGGKTYEIVGIYENGSAYEDAGGAILLRDAQEIFHKPRQVSFLGIALHDPSRAHEIAQQLEQAFPELMVAKTSELVERTNDLATTHALVNALVILTMLVGGIVMTNAMLMSVFERTQEIGVLRAVGWRRRRIVRMVLLESVVLSGLSAVVGIAIGMGLAYAFTLIPVYGVFLLPTFTTSLFTQVCVLALVLGAMGGVYPAWRAASLRPIEALRYE
jgi:ABC-type antimicrobial peptide transport system permease subunit